MIYKKGQLPNFIKEAKTVFENLLTRYLNEQDQNLDGTLNGGIRFDEHFDGVILDYTSNAIADTQDTVVHGLKRIPTGFIVLDIDKGAVIYRSTAFDITNVYLKSTVATTAATLLVF